jgi:FkbM family methyltransferase
MSKIADLFFQFLNKRVKKSVYIIQFGILKNTKIYSKLIFGQIFGFYEFKLFKLIATLINKNTECTNLGAYNGYSALKLKKLILPHLRILAYEANEDLYLDFFKTIDLNKITGIELFHNTISYGDANFKIDSSEMISKDYNINKIKKNEAIRSQQEVSPKVGELSTIRLGVPKTLKEVHDSIKSLSNQILFADIEGFEEDIIDNEDINVFDKYYLVVIEYHSQNILKKYIDKLLTVKGFKLTKKIYKYEKNLVYQIIQRNSENGHLVFYNPKIVI